MSPRRDSAFKRFRQEWRVMDFYERFEQTIAFILAAVIAVIVAISLMQPVRTVFMLLFLEAFNPLDHQVFQTVFGMIMTLLIALIALSRKFVILDPDASPGKIAALAGAVLALGVVYRLLRERDERAAVKAAP